MDRFGAAGCLSTLARVRAASLPPDARAEYFSLKGTALQQTGRYAEAVRAFSGAVQRFAAVGNIFEFRRTCLTLGDLARQRERYREASRWYEKALRRRSLVRAAGSSAESRAVARDAALGKALCWRGLGRYPEAERCLAKLVADYRRANDREGEAYARWALGTTQRFRGILADSEKNLRRSVSLYRHLKDVNGLAYARCGLGGALRMRGRARESGRLYAQAERTFRRHGDDFGRAYALCGQANATRLAGSLSRALSGFSNAAALYRRLGQKGPLGFVLWSTAQAHLAAGDFSAARRALTRSEALFHAVADRRGKVYADLGWGEYARLSETPQKAVAFYRRARRGAERLGLRLEVAHALRGLSARDSWRLYRRCGVLPSHFRLYRFLP